jgi:hypothetical protein
MYKNPTLVALRECWELHSLDRENEDPCTSYVEYGDFRFFYGLNLDQTEEIKVVIIHPDGEELVILHKLYGNNGPLAYPNIWIPGPWNMALCRAMDYIEQANEKERTRKYQKFGGWF